MRRRNSQTPLILPTLFVLSAGVAAFQLPPPGHRSDADALCADKAAPHQSKSLSGRGWQVRIGLDPCVSIVDAKKVLSAIHDKRLVNRQLPSTPGITAGPRPLPEPRLAQILSIALSDERHLATVPEGRLTVMTGGASSSRSGLVLLVAVRGDDVELYLVSDWME